MADVERELQAAIAIAEAQESSVLLSQWNARLLLRAVQEAKRQRHEAVSHADDDAGGNDEQGN